MLNGIITALITPFKNNKVDYEGFRQNIQFQLDSGINGLLILGTTAESPTLTHIEQENLVREAVKLAKGKCPIIVGTGTNNTKTTIEKTLWAQNLGADYAHIVSPYYNKPTQNGIIEHFTAISNGTSLPIVIYNHPFRTGQNIEPETILKLSQIKNITGIKDASSSLDYMHTLQSSLVPAKFSYFSGNDLELLSSLTHASAGLISVISNLMPSFTVDIYNQFKSGKLDSSLNLFYDLYPLILASNFETNPIGIKALMNETNMAAGELRLPLTTFDSKYLPKLQTTIKTFEKKHGPIKYTH